MLYGLYLSASGLQAQDQRLAVITNNLANSGPNNYGFKRDLTTLRARLNATQEDPSMAQYRTPELQNQGGGVWLQAGGIDLSQGILQKTDNDTDLALNGPGFFVVQGAKAGETALTRNGQFLIQSDGTLVNSEGRAVLAASGEPVKLTPGLPVTVSAQGLVSQGAGGSNGDGVQLKLVDVSDSRQLIKLGGGLMTVSNPNSLKDVSGDTSVRQHVLEQSGVDPVVEMVNMMESQRAFDANAKMITLQDQTLAQANQIGRIA